VQPYVIILPLVSVVKTPTKPHTRPHSAETRLVMIKVRELSRKLMSRELSSDSYRLQLLAAITSLSSDELRALAQIIFHNVDHNP